MRIQLISMAVLIGCQVDAGDTDREDPGQVDETATIAVTAEKMSQNQASPLRLKTW